MPSSVCGVRVCVRGERRVLEDPQGPAARRVAVETCVNRPAHSDRHVHATQHPRGIGGRPLGRIGAADHPKWARLGAGVVSSHHHQAIPTAVCVAFLGSPTGLLRHTPGQILGGPPAATKHPGGSGLLERAATDGNQPRRCTRVRHDSPAPCGATAVVSPAPRSAIQTQGRRTTQAHVRAVPLRATTSPPALPSSTPRYDRGGGPQAGLTAVGKLHPST